MIGLLDHKLKHTNSDNPYEDLIGWMRESIQAQVSHDNRNKPLIPLETSNGRDVDKMLQTLYAIAPSMSYTKIEKEVRAIKNDNSLNKEQQQKQQMKLLQKSYRLIKHIQKIQNESKYDQPTENYYRNLFNNKVEYRNYNYKTSSALGHLEREKAFYNSFRKLWLKPENQRNAIVID